MTVYGVILMTVLTHSAYKGSKVLISLYALELGAQPWMIGFLFSMYAVFPILLSVYAGKLSDRFGVRFPMLFGACGLLTGLLLPYFWPQLAMLYVSALVAGVCYIFYIVSVQHLIGSFGDGAQRTRNYSLFSLGVGVTALVGPMTTGFAIDAFGHRNTYLLLAAFPLIPIVVLAACVKFLPKPQSPKEKPEGQKVFDLFQNAPLRRVLMTGGIIETGLELFNFYLPIYARSQGLSASQIGMIMGSYAVAMLIMRAGMPAITKRINEARLLSVSLLVTASICLLFPLFSGFGPLACMAFLLGIGLGCGSPLSLILVYNHAPAGRAGEAMGLRQSINKGNETVMPVIFGLVATFTGEAAVFWMNAVLISIGSAIMHRDGKGKMDESNSARSAS
ncbi:MAG: MFS transporter [Burkholderiales bacterium]